MTWNGGVRLSRRTVLRGGACGLLVAAAPALGGLAPAGPADGISALAFDGSTLVAAGGGLRRSPDGGASWEPLAEPDGEILALAAHPDRHGTLFAGTASGAVLGSRDGGRSWTDRSTGLPGGAVRALAIAARTPDTLYAAIESDGLWTSEDGGASWTLAMDRPYADGVEHDLLALASVDTESGMGGIWVYAGTEAGLTRVPDCFCRWQEVRPGNAMDALVSGEAPPPEKPLPKGESVISLAAAPTDPALIYAGLPSEIWKSTDAGVSWAKAHDAAMPRLALDPEDALHVVAATGAGILTSRDGGLTWTAPGA